MKLKMKPLVLAMAMMGALPAHALMDNGTNENGSSLLLVKYDRAAGVSSTFDLGYNYKDFSLNNTSFTGTGSSALLSNQSWDLTTGDFAQAFNSFRGLADTSQIRWGVFAVDSVGPGTGATGIIQTFNTVNSPAPTNMTNSQVATQLGNANTFINGGNFAGDKVVSNHNDVADGSDVSSATGNGNMLNLYVGDSVNGVGGIATASYDETMTLVERLGGGGALSRSTVAFYEADGVRSSFSLTEAGELTFTSATATATATPTPTPTPGLVDLRSNTQALRGIYNMQTAVINAGLNYDCMTFSTEGLCLSAGGRVTNSSSPSTNAQAALIIASYQATPNVRIGGYLDQNVSNKETRDIEFDNNNPMAGAFAVWNQNQDRTGFEMRLSAGFSNDDITISRNTGLNSQAGSGDAALRSRAFQAVLSHGFQIADSNWIASPYFGVRYTKIERGSYSEELRANVSAPLSYNALSHKTSTLMAGVRFNGKVGEKVFLLASAGLESDISDSTSDYVAKHANGAMVLNGNSLQFGHNLSRTRPVVQVGMNYAIDNRQSIGAHASFREEAFNSSNSVTGLINYQIGF